jgi:oligosaccharide repeat unit polymerase
MSQEWTVAVLIILAVGNYWIRRSVLYPPFLFTCMWLLAVGLDWLDLVETDSLHGDTLTLIAVGAAVFTVGGLLALLVPSDVIRARLVLIRFPPRNEWLKPLLILFLLCNIPMQIKSLRAEAAVGTGGTFLERARNGGIEAQRNGTAIEGQAPGISIYFVFWSLFTTVLFMIEKKDKYFWMVAGLALVMAILTTGRSSLLQLFAAVTCVQLLTTGRTRFLSAIKIARVPIGLFLFMYIGLVFVNKSDQSQFYAQSAAQVALVFFVEYLVGPVAALDQFIQNPGSTALIPNHTFKFYLGVLNSLHVISYSPPPTLEEFALVPYPVNVYTLYKDYIIDFGMYGAMLAIAVIAFLHVLLYRKARTGSMLGIFLFALSIFPVVMAGFSDQYSSLGNWTDAIFFGVIYVMLRAFPMRLMPRLEQGYVAPG